MTSKYQRGRLPAAVPSLATLRPVAALIAVALSWGVAYVLVKSAVSEIPPAAVVAWRFTIAAVLIWACNPRCLKNLSRRTLARSAVLGCLFGAGFLMQTWGIQFTSIVVSAFITGSVVVLAPLVARVWFGRRLGSSARLAVGLATAGLALISLRGAAFGLGELLHLRRQRPPGPCIWWRSRPGWTRPRSTPRLWSNWWSSPSSAGRCRRSRREVSFSRRRHRAWVAVVVLGAIATGTALLLLTWAQARVDSTTAAVVLTLEPVFGAVAAVAIGGEELAGLTTIGAISVIVAAVVAARAGPGTPLVGDRSHTAAPGYRRPRMVGAGR